jgi:hypothetical protein
MVDGEAVLEAVRAAGVLGDVPADRADLLARGVGGVEPAVARDRARDVQVGDAGLDDNALGLEVDLEDPVHPGERDHDAVGDRQRAPREPGAGAARDERDPLAVARAHDRLHLGRRGGQRDEGGERAPAGEAVAVVDLELRRLGEHVRRPQRRPELLDDRRHAHASILLRRFAAPAETSNVAT